MSDPWADFIPQAKGDPWADFIAPPPAETVKQAEKPGVFYDMLKSAGSGLATGATSLLGLPGDALRLGSRLGIFPANPPIPGSQEIKSAVEARTGEFYKPQTTAGEYAKTIGEFIPASVLGPGNVARNAGIGVLAGVGSEAAGQATAGQPAELWARLAGGLAGAIAPAAIGRAITPLPMQDPTRAAMIDALRREGVPLTAGQTSGSKSLQYMESLSNDLPLAGARAGAIETAQKEAFTGAALKRMGVDANRALPETMSAGRENLSKTFDDVAARNQVQIDQPALQKIGDAVREYTANSLPTQQVPNVSNITMDLINKARSGGLDGRAYQSLRSDLGRWAQEKRFSDPTLAGFYKNIQRTLDDAFVRSVPAGSDDAITLATARRQWGNMKDIEKAAAGAGENAALGLISPAQIRSAVSSGNNRGQYARGEGDLAELARAGNAVMSPLPQSGTQPRQLAQMMLSAPGIAAGGVAGGWTGAGLGAAALPVSAGLMARALMSSPVQGYLSNQATQRIPLLAQATSGADKQLIGRLLAAELAATRTAQGQ